MEYPPMRLPNMAGGDDAISQEHLPMKPALWGNTDVIIGHFVPKAAYLFGLQADNESRDMTEEFAWGIQEEENDV